MKLRPPKWWYEEQGAMATALKPVSRIYGRIAEKKASKAAPYLSRLPVICIGNFTVGGSGKTPTAIAVAQILKIAGERPAFLTRGYGGKEDGPIRLTEGMDAARVGDEPLLLAEHAPTIVSADREKGAKLIETMDATVIVMDDGFQNPSIGKDLSLICVDAKTGIGNAMVLPSGPLRAPLEPQIRMADALIVVGEGNKANGLIDRFTEAGKLVLKAEIGFRQDTRWLGVLPVIGFAGIEWPEAQGGSGLGALARCLVLEELAAADPGAAIALDPFGPALYPLLEMSGPDAANTPGRTLLDTPGGRALLVWNGSSVTTIRCRSPCSISSITARERTTTRPWPVWYACRTPSRPMMIPGRAV